MLLIQNQIVTLDGLQSIANNIAAILGHDLKIVCIYGDLGAGKTTLCRFLINSLAGVPTIVTSPTFCILQIYDFDLRQIYHYDLYRIENKQELLDLSIDNALNNICLIEWPEIIEDFLPTNIIKIKLQYYNEYQRILNINSF